MTKRVVECNICGEPLAAATNDELLGRLRDHLESVHDGTGAEEDQLRRMIADEAYDAADS